MVAEPWLVKIGSHFLQPCSKKSTRNKEEIQSKTPETIGILSFEVANVMSKTVRLHKSLTNSEISNLKTQILTSNGVKTLISSDELYLLDLALSEKLSELDFIAGVVSRLGKKCTIPHLQGFQHVYRDIVTGVIDVADLGFLVKDMDAMVRKLERFVNSTSNLYGELTVLNELEITTKKFQQNQHEESKKVFEQKLNWQIQDVRHLKNVSLWNQTYDKIVEILARTVCTLYARIFSVFNDSISRKEIFSSTSVSVSSKKSNSSRSSQNSNQISGSSISPFKEHKMVLKGNLVKTHRNVPQSKLKVSPPSNTIGGSSFALHYANIIIVIEKLLNYPHLVTEEARDDLYQMLPTSLRLKLRQNLKSFSKDLAIFDAPIAHNWKDRLDGILSWFAPMAHNMIRWQTERNFEQQHFVSRSNVLLLETLYFADLEKTEGAISELLVGLNYICRYEHQQNVLFDCGSSFDFDDCTDWQLQ